MNGLNYTIADFGRKAGADTMLQLVFKKEEEEQPEKKSFFETLKEALFLQKQ